MRVTNTRGVWLAIGAYATWGTFPIYWKLLAIVPATQIIAHRIAWSFLVLIPLVLRRRMLAGGSSRRITAGSVGVYALAGLLISGNWLLYVWAVNHGFIVETSLGYFISPLLNVLIGVVVLREHLPRVQWIAVALAAAGVVYLTFLYGALPWIATGLALSFGTYSLVKKKAPYHALPGLTIETGVLFLPAVLYLLTAERHGAGAFGHAGLVATLMLAGSGIITTIPLLMFAAAVQRVPLSLIGIIQYISPTLQFLIGVLVYHEPFSHHQLIGFSLVWTALAILGADSFRNARLARRGYSLPAGGCDA